MRNDFFQDYYTWAKGEIEQGKWMVTAAILLVPVLILFLKNTNVILRGMTLPLFLLFVVNIGYGGYLLMNRNQQEQKVEMHIKLSTEDALKKESQKLKKDHNVFLMLKKIWVILIVIFLISYLMIPEGYYKGLALGFVIMFVGLLTVDTLLHHRLIQYLAGVDLKIESVSR